MSKRRERAHKISSASSSSSLSACHRWHPVVVSWSSVSAFVTSIRRCRCRTHGHSLHLHLMLQLRSHAASVIVVSTRTATAIDTFGMHMPQPFPVAASAKVNMDLLCQPPVVDPGTPSPAKRGRPSCQHGPRRAKNRPAKVDEDLARRRVQKLSAKADEDSATVIVKPRATPTIAVPLARCPDLVTFGSVCNGQGHDSPQVSTGPGVLFETFHHIVGPRPRESVASESALAEHRGLAVQHAGLASKACSSAAHPRPELRVVRVQREQRLQPFQDNMAFRRHG